MSDTTEIRTEMDLTPIERTVTQRPCLCGCGGFPQRASADFIPGHDAKLKGMLIKAHLTGVEWITVTDENGTRDMTPLELAETRHWSGALMDAKSKADAKEKAKAEKAATN